MERACIRASKDSQWTEEALPEVYHRPAVRRNHVLVAGLLSIALLTGLATGLRYGYEQTGDVERLLATKTCENCNLSRTNLAGACLARAKLRSASLKGADLSVADLSDADLRDADLSGASLYRANLTGADLRGANVTGVLLLFADVSGALWTDGRTCPPMRRR